MAPTFPDVLITPVDAALRKSRFDYANLGGYHWWLTPVVRILIVTDGSGSFDSQREFGLGLMLAEMAADPWWWVRFSIVTAHRRTGTPEAGTASIQNFRFDTPPPGSALDTFDEVWLFGVEGRRVPGDPPPAANSMLTGAEIDAVRDFMNAGGGVFATGDHWGLGESMCGALPRISKMRRWAPGGPVGEPPSPFGDRRYDTVREGPTTGYQFDDQEDDVPQEIYPKRYFDWRTSTIIQRRWRPHPVLCGITGVIDVLPDHMHENRIVQPNPAIYGNASEWPGNQPHEVIANARVIPHTNSDGFGYAAGPAAEEGLTEGVFGVLGAYEGHWQNVGRIVVDATWHHWFNINLRGFDRASTHYGKIKNYFWNVGAWLAPKARQRQLFDVAVHGLVHIQPYNELSFSTDILWLGFSGIDAIGRRASQCKVTDWLVDVLPPNLQEMMRRIPIPNPPDPAPLAGLDGLLELALGGILREHMRERDRLGPSAKRDPRRLAELTELGAAEGLREFAKHRERELEAARHSLALVQRALRASAPRAE